ncbi:hypothetical protein EVAR_16095_1 [Eumeta japonica]|uniref:Uncharacterized protein n=1 Tax=Eumeta variegata TaxID=151549 RepID=A0A4C1UJT1_EUMVA|nr:hypothetical protein EVAR_16095_1 [Eumeta japonica]
MWRLVLPAEDYTVIMGSCRAVAGPRAGRVVPGAVVSASTALQKENNVGSPPAGPPSKHPARRYRGGQTSVVAKKGDNGRDCSSKRRSEYAQKPPGRAYRPTLRLSRSISRSNFARKSFLTDTGMGVTVCWLTTHCVSAFYPIVTWTSAATHVYVARSLAGHDNNRKSISCDDIIIGDS